MSNDTVRHPWRRRAASAFAVAAVVATGLLVAETPAGAFGGEHGVLLIHGAGTTYTGSGATVSKMVAAGGVGSYSFKVKNTGGTDAQFNVVALNYAETCNPMGCPAFPTLTVTAGSLVVTKMATGPNGYFTAPIAPGKSITYTLKVDLDAATVPTDMASSLLRLRDTAGNQLDMETVYTEVTATKGTTAADQFVVGGSQSSAGGWLTPSLITKVANPPVAVGAPTKYTVKLVNNSGAAASISYQLANFQTCGVFTVKVLAGTVDVTSAVRNGTYVTPSLAPAKSVTLTVSVTLNATLGCTTTSYIFRGTSTSGSAQKMVDLVTNPVVT